jgi:hypothetical protein
VGGLRNTYANKIIDLKLSGNVAFRDIDVDGKIILKYILGKYVVSAWAGLNWLRIRLIIRK